MGQIGHIEEFDISSSNFDDWKELLEYYFQANGITITAKQKAVSLSNCGEDTFSLLRNIFLPAEIKDLTHEDLTVKLRSHVKPTTNVVIERFNFYLCRQTQSESVCDFIAKLKKFFRLCELGTTVNLMLPDMLVVGVKNPSIQKQLRNNLPLLGPLSWPLPRRQRNGNSQPLLVLLPVVRAIR